MTRTELLAKTRTLIEDACTNSETKLVIDMALLGVPPEQILDTYRFCQDWNAQVLIDGLKEAERLLDNEIQQQQRHADQEAEHG